MPHARYRFASQKIQKKLALHPVLAIQGARQTGKSFLVREWLRSDRQGAKYLSFDDLSTRNSAQLSPRSFLLENDEARPLILDEAQKVPEIFDAIKFEVDQSRRPGRFLLLGSTEFSRLTRIRESLTGRMGRIRLFPLTLQEVLATGPRAPHVNRATLLKYLTAGGMPGIFSLRNHEEIHSLYQDWVELTCYRDLQQFQGLKLSGEIAIQILRLASTLEEPTRANFARTLRLDPRRVETHLKALCELFVLQKLEPHPSGTGKPIFLPFEVGLADYFAASRERKLHVLLVNERMAANSYYNIKQNVFYYYRSSGRQVVHLLEAGMDGHLTAFQIIDHERIKKTDALLMAAFLKKNRGAEGRVLAPVLESHKINGIKFVPWEEMVHK